MSRSWLAQVRIFVSQTASGGPTKSNSIFQIGSATRCNFPKSDDSVIGFELLHTHCKFLSGFQCYDRVRLTDILEAQKLHCDMSG